MARKPKAVVAPVELVEVITVDQFIEVLQANPEVQAEQDAEEDMDVQPSMMSQLVAQVVESSPEVVVKAEKNEGVGQFIRKLIGEGLGNKEVLAIVHEQYGNKNTTYACVAWYRNKMKKAGVVQQVTTSLDWLQNFAKANGLSEESTEQLGKVLKVA